MPPDLLSTLAPGTLLGGRYRIESALARGGMGAVYAAEDDKLGRSVAIKLLRAELGEDRTAHKRFEREAVLVARLAHPGIAQVLDFGVADDGASFIVLERVPGQTVAQLLQHEGRLAPGRAAEIARQSLDALAAAHAAGVIHRDLKPGNLMVFATGAGREAAKVLDFGIAQLMAGDAYTRLTSTGAILGTPAYMAPEQAMGQPTDVRTDVYAMGVLLYCMLSGRRPFQGTPVAVLEAILRGSATPLPVLVPDVPVELSRVVERAMQRDPALRFESAQAMSSAVAEAQRAARMPGTGIWASPPPASIPPFAPPSSAIASDPSMAPTDAFAAPGSTVRDASGVSTAMTGITGLGAVTGVHASGARPFEPARGSFTRGRVLALVALAATAGAALVAAAGAALFFLWPTIRAGGDAAVQGHPPVASAPGSGAASDVTTGSVPTVSPASAAPGLEHGGPICRQASLCCVAHMASYGGPSGHCSTFESMSDEGSCAAYLRRTRGSGFEGAACVLDPSLASTAADRDACMRAYTCCTAWAVNDQERLRDCLALMEPHDAAFCDAERARYATLVPEMFCR